MPSKLALATCALFFLAISNVLGSDAKNSGRSFYVNSADPSADDSGPASIDHPWKSLAALNSHTFKPGESVYFARGSSYNGGVLIKDSGTDSSPIVLTQYGKGPLPSFSNSNFNVLNGNVIQIKGSYIIVDGFYFHDGAQSPTTKDADVLRVADVFIGKGADHNIIRNSEVKNSPVGFHICGQFNLITRNHLHDTNRHLAPGANWGPIAIVLSNGNNEVSYNRITNYVSIGGKYGADGGALEFDPRIYGDPIHDVKIHHNYSYGNEGFLESTRSDSQATGRVWIAYNITNDYQEFILLWQGHDWHIENNTVLRVLPKNSVTDVVFTFREGGNTVWNNVFVVSSGRKVFSDNGTQVYGMANWAGQTHFANIYFSVDATQSDPVGVALGRGEKIADPKFADFAKSDFHLTSGSPAVDAGEPTDFPTDFDGNPVPSGKAPDIGAYEFRERNR